MFQQTFCFCFGTFATCHCFPNKAAAQTEDARGKNEQGLIHLSKETWEENHSWLQSHLEKSKDSGSDSSEVAKARWCSIVLVGSLERIQTSNWWKKSWIWLKTIQIYKLVNIFGYILIPHDCKYSQHSCWYCKISVFIAYIQTNTSHPTDMLEFEHILFFSVDVWLLL